MTMMMSAFFDCFDILGLRLDNPRLKILELCLCSSCIYPIAIDTDSQKTSPAIQFSSPVARRLRSHVHKGWIFGMLRKDNH